MAYNEFDLDRVQRAFSLDLNDREDLFAWVPPIAESPSLRSHLDENVPLALNVNTERIRSEIIIAPVLLEVRRLMGRRIGFFSGVEFNVSREQGLSGYCDFILSRSLHQVILSTPIVTIVEAKKEDIIGGLGQFAAEMVAARLFNEQRGETPQPIYGAVTSGTNWRFLKLDSRTIFVDWPEYVLEPVGKILAILLHCVGGDPANAGAAA